MPGSCPLDHSVHAYITYISLVYKRRVDSDTTTLKGKLHGEQVRELPALVITKVPCQVYDNSVCLCGTGVQLADCRIKRQTLLN